MGCGINLTLDDGGTCTAARVSLGAVAARPLLVEGAADALIGTKVDDDAMEALAAAASAACSPIDDKRGTIEYRRSRRRAGPENRCHCAGKGEILMAKQYVNTTINGDSHELLCDPTQTLLDVLRGQLDMTGTKEGRGTGDCGARSVTMDGVLVCSCW